MRGLETWLGGRKSEEELGAGRRGQGFGGGRLGAWRGWRTQGGLSQPGRRVRSGQVLQKKPGMSRRGVHTHRDLVRRPSQYQAFWGGRASGQLADPG